MPRLTKIYTRKGDEGYTSLGNGTLSKDDALVEVVGTVDELNAAIGLVLAFPIKDEGIIKCLTRVQNELFDLGGELHVPEHPAISAEKVLQLEKDLDGWNDALPTLQEFILPRGNQATAACHLARTICRRAERAVVKLHRQAKLTNPDILRYLNRLSDLLFVICRVLSRETQGEEMMWERE